ncbi:MAG: hypothetical protein Q9182_000024 [Xanthomendoza sp. 2 TL-2023]
MPSDNVAALSAFVEGAPPGELADVVADIKKLTVNEPKLLESITPAFKKYNEEQLSTVKLPGSSNNVLISPYNRLADGRYYDVETQKSFVFDHQIQKASDVQPYALDSEYPDLISSLLKTMSTHSTEHYPSATYTVCPTPTSPNTLALLLVSNKYSPSNFCNGRYRSTYFFTPSSSSLTGTINVDVHYYEDGNVRLSTSKKISEDLTLGEGSGAATIAAEVLSIIARVEKGYQEELDRGFTRLSEGEFKGLRRQLPVTRQKVEWEKVGGYRVSTLDLQNLGSCPLGKAGAGIEKSMMLMLWG